MPLKDAFHRGVSRATEPQLLFPLIALFLLASIWGTTFGVLRVRHADAEHTAAVSSRELLGTYEAQVVRALREIDQALKLVKSWPERRASRHTLADLKDKGLLPPDMVFTVAIADHDGTILESTRPFGQPSVADQDTFRTQRNKDVLFTGQLPRGPTGEQKLQFSRRLNTAEGTFDGVVIVTIDADFFVSGYEPAKLGEHGVLGLLGADSVFRVRRTGIRCTRGIQSITQPRWRAPIPRIGMPARQSAHGMGPYDGLARANCTGFRSQFSSDYRWKSKWRAHSDRCASL